VWLKLLQGLGRIIDERKTGCLSTTKLSLETEDIDLVLVGFVEFGKLGSELVLGDVGAVGVEDIDNHLLAAEERVANKFARTQSYWLVRHVCDLVRESIDPDSVWKLSRQVSRSDGRDVAVLRLKSRRSR